MNITDITGRRGDKAVQAKILETILEELVLMLNAKYASWQEMSHREYVAALMFQLDLEPGAPTGKMQTRLREEGLMLRPVGHCVSMDSYREKNPTDG